MNQETTLSEEWRQNSKLKKTCLLRSRPDIQPGLDKALRCDMKACRVGKHKAPYVFNEPQMISR